MDFDSVIKKRKSVRSFRPRKPNYKDIIEAIDAAIQAPFANSRCHLHYILIENPKTIEQISKLAEQLWITESNFLAVVCSDDTDLENAYGERGRIYSRQQAGASIQNFLLKLTDLGLSTCWVGSYSDRAIRKLLSVPSNVQIEAIIPIGYGRPAPSPRRKERKIENYIYWEEWKKWRRPTFFKEPPTIHQPSELSFTK